MIFQPTANLETTQGQLAITHYVQSMWSHIFLLFISYKFINTLCLFSSLKLLKQLNYRFGI